MLRNERILFLGAGYMAEAMIAGLLNKNLLPKEQIVVTNRSKVERLEYLNKTYGIRTTTSPSNELHTASLIILAMKPQDLTSGIDRIKGKLQSHHTIISVLAGIETSLIEHLLEDDVPIVRAMPNTSATVGRSATAICRGRHATLDTMNTSEALFQSVGMVTTLSEEHLNAVTGLSGSGPAFFYYMVECFQKAAEQLGLEEAHARPLIYETIAGAAEMLKTQAVDASTLKQNVTSKGGTTEAGLSYLQDRDYESTITTSIKRAAERAAEIGASFNKEHSFHNQ
ncbi:pyrroline-5-carboxylate reductase [Pontibacillus halophilus JSM 076056 = DSM 19796]|uniref:Pyrroline-5-carboxylate reductase n=1 Tax=Pontibacillus halophilus JSM 076056 = DSM 19796 TaxID=1385510 RepID=A0A0A5GJW1_9BACI|nr:pyrroline-5-carboxylate reductase [Pontibacillus halophilus]KGX93521.1 pyrroline-5-carboxylate reductase [Pontibacillus halophilus JSM 076056 = DSM 19796]